MQTDPDQKQKYTYIVLTPLNPTHYESMPIQIYWNFYHQNMKIFR